MDNGSFHFRWNHAFMNDGTSLRNLCDNISATKKISFFYGDVCFPFLFTVQRINSDTASDKSSAALGDFFKRTFDTIKNII